MRKIPLVSFMGASALAHPAIQICLRSWGRADFASAIHVLSDGSLDKTLVEDFGEPGLKLIPIDECEEMVRQALGTRPALRIMRERSVMFRKIVDIPLWFRDCPEIVYSDTDIFFARHLLLPEGEFELVMGVDDSTSYSGSWRIATEEKALPGLNAGFLFYRPSIIDFDYLEFLCKRYFLKCQNPWLSEQPIWAILMNRLDKTALFDGRDARVIGAVGKRTREDILSNRFAWIKRGSPVTCEADVRPLIEGVAVAHMAGCGKRWIHLCEGAVSESEGPHVLRTVSTPRSTLALRLATAARIFATEAIAGRKRR